MPKDSKGNFHLNTQRAHASDRIRSGGPQPSNSAAHDSGKEPMPAGEDQMHSQIHEHLESMQAQHGGKHMHVHHKQDGGIQSHQIGEDGNVEGPHDHDNIEALKEHMGRFLDEEANEYTDHQHQEHGAGMHDGGSDGLY